MKHLLFYFSLCCGLFSFSQNESQKTNPIQDRYKTYFELPRETLYTHLNKTTFIAGEEIWFKTYAFDRHQNLPSKATTNINVGIYDDNGKLIKNKLWLALDGSTHGNFFIDSTFTTGEYYIKASTNWMKNFEQNDAFIQKIKIIANDFDAKVDSITNVYDFQFLPEGGYLVYDLTNTLGFKIIDSNGKGVKISGTIYNTNNREITTFNSNAFGLGKCLFKPEFGQSYFAKINLPNGSVITKDISSIKTKGIALRVNSLRPQDLAIDIYTNEFTHNIIKYKIFTLLIHKDGTSQSIDFSFDALQKKSFIIPKEDLFNGINTITIFDDNHKPITERLVYVPSEKNERSPIAINLIKRKNDTLSFSLYSLNPKTSNVVKHNLSVSILPQSTISYDPDHNIMSAIRLKPYLQGYIENPKYYFEDIDNKKLYELDLLLLTQGWSRYSWNSIFNNPPKPIFEFENGVTLVGKIKDDDNTKRLRLQDPKLKGNEWSNIQVASDNTFEVKKYFPLLGETIRIAYFDNQGNLTKPNLYVRCQLNGFVDKLLPKDVLQHNSTLIDSSLPNKMLTQNFFYQNLVELEEVVVETRLKKKRLKAMGIGINSVTNKNNYTAVTQEVATNFPTVVDLITSQGGYTTARSSQFGGLQIVSIRANTINGSRSPIIFLDDIPLSDFDYLITLATSDIEGILIDKDGFGSGINGANGVIRIYTRRTPLQDFTNNQRAFAHESKANIGFTEPKVFYTPKYTSYDDDLFKNYGAIGWFPNINLTPNQSKLIKIPDTETSKLKVYIEGFDSEGTLISEVRSIEVQY